MKALIIYLFSIFMITNINAQSQPNYKTEILSVLKNKHEYEKNAIPNREKKNKDYKVQYTNSFVKIKNDKAALAYINKAIRENSEGLKKETVWYKYQDPLSSNVDFKNRISLLDFYKIIKYSIENKKDELPKLSEVSLK